MTKRDFIAVAEMLRVELDGAVAKRHLSEADAIARVARKLATLLAARNGSFRFDSFYAAIGLTSDGFRPIDLGTGLVP